MSTPPDQSTTSDDAPTPAAPLTTGSITWTPEAETKTLGIIYNYTLALQKRSEEEAQINMSSSVSAHYVDSAARQLRLVTQQKKGTALLTNVGSLFAGGALSTGAGTMMAETPSITLLAVSAIVFAAGMCSLVFGSSRS